MAEIYGFPNRVVTEMIGALLQKQEVLKFLTYTSVDNEDILSKPPVENPSDLLDRNIFVNRRIPYIRGEVGAYVTFRMSDLRPSSSKNKKVKDTTINVLVVVHEQCLKTQNGTRDIALVSGIQEVFEDKSFSGIGDCKIVRTADINGLPVEYSGYNIICEVSGLVTKV